MRKIHGLIKAATLCLCLIPALAIAHDYKAGDVVIGHPWTRATTGSGQNGAAYLTLVNNGKEADRLIKASTPAAQKAELHTHLVEDGVMKMRPVEGIDIEPGAPLELKPGGLHVMLLGLKEPLKDGGKIPLTLTFQKAGDVTVEVQVESAGAMEPAHEGSATH
ncbi:MAG TPA: copper chaperone PCu(A)C [Patescibacteria group bacterium]|nr:copper chaperone PCu(A)C [Patescibacteria group bacterium]